jgi:type IV fimbrial biogenesis protein FimT
MKSAPAPGLAGGYTLVELLTTLCIAGIVLSMALPGLDALLMDGRRTAVVNDLVLTLMVARSETIKRGGRALVACGLQDTNGNGRLDPEERRCAGRDWSDGWMLGTWSDDDADSTVGPAEFTPIRVFQTPAARDLTVIAGNFMASPPVRPAGTMLIKSFGRRTSNGTITVCDRRGAGAARAVIVSSLGRARVSSTRADGTPLRCP